jgi:phospholipid/cholesterol/gamma-HCH transport system permease protein
MTAIFSGLGRFTLQAFAYVGELTGLVGQVLESLWRGKKRLRLFAEQLVAIGYGSQVVVIITGAFIGAVFAFQVYSKFKDLGLETAVGAMVSVAMCRELGPSISALMVAGRVGAAMAAEIGTMRVTEQIDALRAFGVHPIDYLVQPRVLAMMISMPLLVAEAIVFGIVCSALVCVWGFDVPWAHYRDHMLEYTHLPDIGIGMIKGLIFGLIIVIISCHQGLQASYGAVGVGRGTTRAVVLSSLWILVTNFFLSLWLNRLWPLPTDSIG